MSIWRRLDAIDVEQTSIASNRRRIDIENLGISLREGYSSGVGRCWVFVYLANSRCAQRGTRPWQATRTCNLRIGSPTPYPFFLLKNNFIYNFVTNSILKKKTVFTVNSNFLDAYLRMPALHPDGDASTCMTALLVSRGGWNHAKEDVKI